MSIAYNLLLSSEILSILFSLLNASSSKVCMELLERDNSDKLLKPLFVSLWIISILLLSKSTDCVFSKLLNALGCMMARQFSLVKESANSANHKESQK